MRLTNWLCFVRSRFWLQPQTRKRSHLTVAVEILEDKVLLAVPANAAPSLSRVNALTGAFEDQAFTITYAKLFASLASEAENNLA